MSGFKLIPKKKADGDTGADRQVVSTPMVVESILPSNFVKLMKAYDEVVESRAAWDTMVSDAAAKIAELTCPFSAGDVIYTDAGLGKNGLVVESVISPVQFSDSNKWALRTFAQTLKGESSNRLVMVQEFQMIGPEQSINVISVKKSKH